MPSTTRPRIDYMLGTAALAALDLSGSRWPDLSRQALMDWLVMCGLSALEHPPWQPPRFYDGNRDRWPIPGKQAQNPPR
jgi:hypothetical protein